MKAGKKKNRDSSAVIFKQIIIYAIKITNLLSFTWHTASSEYPD